MFKYLYHLILVILVSFFVSCSSNFKHTETYFGGKIINPKSDYVVLYSMDKVIDTMYLGKDNTFLGKFEHVNEGLYYFMHGNENQYIYLEPQDSLMLRLNTWSFDESMVFAGRGAERNNILIDYFLEDEKDNRMFYKLNRLEPDQFLKKVDSLLALKLVIHEEYVSSHPNETNGFLQILKIALTHPIYARIERYPIAHVKNNNKTEFHTISSSFYNHRKIIPIDNDTLLYYPPYSKYVRNFLYNTTYSLGHKPMSNEYSSDFTIDLLKTIDRSITPKKSKNAFLKQTVIGHFFRKSSCNVNKKAFKTYFNLSTSDQDKILVDKLLSDCMYFEKGQKIVDFMMTDFNNKSNSIKKITKNKNSLLLFWNPSFITTSYISSRINYLSQKFPEIQFIQIKMDGTLNDRIHQLDIKNQFFINSNNSANNFLTSKMPRTIILNSKGAIINGFASIASKKIHTELKSLSKY